ncbi:helix-turn-helix domain-containing protein [Streptomyces sp. NPDC004134]|uniref:helix-turn-helix domain-containing protein n=1 Tax=Streptomyces sp. NPDC004134 TaxID=3364691 RepID=UPI0036BBC70D
MADVEPGQSCGQAVRAWSPRRWSSESLVCSEGVVGVPARLIALTASERERLKNVAYGHKTEYRLRARAQVVLHAAGGRSNARIARETGLHLDTVRRWRGRFAEQRMAGLADRRRSGRPPAFTALQIAEVKALACRLPAETGVPLSRWSCPELARETVARGIATFVSASTVRRWLDRDALKPWQHRSRIFITDPDFRVKPSACWTCTPAPGWVSHSARTST